MEKEQLNLSQKKPTLEEFLKNSELVYKKYIGLFGEHYSLDKYLEVQRAFYRQNIADLSQEDYEKLIKEANKAVLKRLNDIVKPKEESDHQ